MVRSSGTETLTMQPANAEYGAVSVSGDGRYLAYGAYVGVLGSPSGYYVTTVVDLSTELPFPPCGISLRRSGSLTIVLSRRRTTSR